MVYTTQGKTYLAHLLGNSGTAPNYVCIGSGSGAVAIGNTGLIFEIDRNALTSTDNTTAQKTTLIADFNTVEMSGTTLREVGLAHLSSGGKLWLREGFAGVEFDGTNELQVEIEVQVF